MTGRLVVLTFTWVALFAFGLSGQQGQPTQPPVFRAGVEAIEFDVFVTDQRGTAVTDLTAGDFAIEEDGVAQKLTSFARVTIPLKASVPEVKALAEADVQTNRRPEGRLYIFAIDTLQPTLELRTRRFLRTFIEEHFVANDIAALVYVGIGQARNTQDFTSNQRLLLRAVDNIMSGFALSPNTPGESSATMALTGAVLLDSEGPRMRMEALRALTESLAQIRGKRKVMLFFTQGIGADVFGTIERPDGAKSLAFDELHAALGAATRGGVAIYPIDPSGLTLDGSLGEAVELRALAYTTGAEAIVNTNTIPDGLARIVRDNSDYYVLGFSSTNSRREGKFRDVRVRVTRPGLVVRTRSGYLEPLERTKSPVMTSVGDVPTALANAIRQPLSNPAVPMDVFAAAFRETDKEARVLIAQEMKADTLDLTREGNEFAGNVSSTTIAVRFDAKVYGGKTLSTPVSIPTDGDRTVRVLTEVRVPPGRYQLRIAGGTPARAGSVMYDLEVPDFRKGRLVMSGVSVAVPSSAVVVENRAQAASGPSRVTTRREFSSDETLTLYTELYENGRKGSAYSVDVKAELRAADGRVVRSVSQQRASQELATRSGFTLDLSLGGAATGDHVLHVEARANTADAPTASRDIPIRIR